MPQNYYLKHYISKKYEDAGKEIDIVKKRPSDGRM
jgi:hypothetical protein